MASLRDKTISGIIWSLLQNVGGKGITFIVTIVLARLLTPEIFGLVAMLAVFIQLSEVLVQAGFNQALIQKKTPDEEDYSSVFWINLIVSLLIYGILYISAPWISAFYEQAVLTPLTRVLSVVFVFNAFSYVQEARLQKEMRFKTLTIIHIPATVLGGIVSIGMAIMGYGVWSLIALQLVTRMAYAVQIWLYAQWQPLFVLNLKKVRRLFAFGGNLMLSAVIHALFENAYLVVIGKFFPLRAVGYYQNAQKLVKVPASTISTALNKAAFPAFSLIQDDNKRLKNGFKKIIQQIVFWVCPLFVLTGVLAEPLFAFVLGTQWLPAVPLFQILCVMGVFYPLNAYNLNIIKVKGRSGLVLRLNIIKKSIVTLGIILTIPYGIKALVAFQAVNAVFATFLNSYYSGRFINYPIVEQLKDIWLIMALSVMAGIAVMGVAYFFVFPSALVQLISGFAVGILLYWGGAKLLNIAPYGEFINIITTIKRKFIS